MVTIRYDCTRQEFTSGQHLLAAPARAAIDRKQSLSNKKNLIGWMLFVGMAVVFFVLMRQNPAAVPVGPPTTRPLEPGIFSMWGLYAAIAGLVLIVAASRMLIHAGWLGFREGIPGSSYTIDEHCVTLITPYARTVMRWEYFTAFAENDLVIVLRQSSNQGHILPKRLFNAEQLEYVRRLFTEKLAIPVPSLVSGFEVKTS